MTICGAASRLALKKCVATWKTQPLRKGLDKMSDYWQQWEQSTRKSGSLLTKYLTLKDGLKRFSLTFRYERKNGVNLALLSLEKSFFLNFKIRTSFLDLMRFSKENRLSRKSKARFPVFFHNFVDQGGLESAINRTIKKNHGALISF